jgi:DNA-binding NarL/FixJ family response regulator
VTQHVARGHSYKEIARELTISVRTVESHTSAVLRKLQLSSRHELTHRAVRHRLL